MIDLFLKEVDILLFMRVEQGNEIQEIHAQGDSRAASSFSAVSLLVSLSP